MALFSVRYCPKIARATGCSIQQPSGLVMLYLILKFYDNLRNTPQHS